MIPARELAEIAAKALDSKKGRDIKVLEIDKITTLADYFVICTAASSTQIKTLGDAVEAALEELGENKIHREGHRSGTWVLLDFGCVVVHLFMEEARQFYNLERLWADAEEIPLDGILTADR